MTTMALMGDRSFPFLLLGLGAVALYLLYRSQLSQSVSLPGSSSVDAPATPAPQTVTATAVSAPFTSQPPATGLANAIENAFNTVFPMHISNNGINLIKSHEGLSLRSYYDVSGYSIGYGHKITPADNTNYGLVNEANVTIGQDLADQLFSDDILKVENTINENVSVVLSQNQFDALCDFVFNVGSSAFLSSTLLKELNAGNYDLAATEFSKWNKSGGAVNPALTQRRTADTGLFQTA